MDRGDLYTGGIRLFPYHYRKFGFLLVLASLITAYLYFWGGRPAFFEVPIFAIITSYAETRWFVLAQTNLLDELAHLFLISGLLIIAFSKEDHESEEIHSCRIRALFYAVYTTSALWIVIYLTVYGWPILIISATVFVQLLIIFILFFRYLLYKKEFGAKIKTEIMGLS